MQNRAFSTPLLPLVEFEAAFRKSIFTGVVGLQLYSRSFSQRSPWFFWIIHFSNFNLIAMPRPFFALADISRIWAIGLKLAARPESVHFITYRVEKMWWNKKLSCWELIVKFSPCFWEKNATSACNLLEKWANSRETFRPIFVVNDTSIICCFYCWTKIYVYLALCPCWFYLFWIIANCVACSSGFSSAQTG